MSLEERFWSKVDRRGERDCWEWQGHRHERGYGIFWHDGKNVRANRYALILSGSAPGDETLLALHSCDNPPCCNPNHLRWGTALDNLDDRLVRTGPIHGEHAPRALITDAIADQILQGRIDGKNASTLAQELGLSKALIENIYSGRAWTHRLGVDGNPTLEELRRARPKRTAPAPNRRLTDQMIDRVFQARMAGMSCPQIAAELGLPLGTVSPVYSGLAFTERLGKFGNPTLEELRSVRGPNPSHKLTEDDVMEIKALLREGFTGTSIAQKFGVSKPTISRIKSAM